MENVMGGVCSMHGKDKKCIQDFGQNIYMEETTPKT
jgi:hypothetical protein